MSVDVKATVYNCASSQSSVVVFFVVSCPTEGLITTKEFQQINGQR